MGGIRADMSPNFLEIDRFKRSRFLVDLFKPAAETQEAHAATVISGMLERDRATCDTSRIMEGPAGTRSKIEGKQRTLRDCDRL